MATETNTQGADHRQETIQTIDQLIRKNDLIGRAICRFTDTLGRDDEEIQLVMYQLCEMLWDNSESLRTEIKKLEDPA